MQMEPIAPPAFLAELSFDWALRFRQEQTSVATEVADDAPVFQADKALLKRVFSNLIQNAVTHSPMPITLSLGARRDGTGIQFTVADDGPGIPAEYQETIFAPFEQLSVPNAPRVFSSGLGLAFCRVVVEQHGGRIWVKSTAGQGSTFHIWLPVG
jgi:signal transduction histidine kinase